MNFFREGLGEAPIAKSAAPSPVVVIHDDGSGCVESPLLDDIDVPEVAVQGRWRQHLLSMDGIELPTCDDLDSLPPLGDVRMPGDPSTDGDPNSGLILSVCDEFLNSGPSLDDPRQLWMDAICDDDVCGMPCQLSDLDDASNSENQQIMTNAALTPGSETAVVPPIHETKLWTGVSAGGESALPQSNQDGQHVPAGEDASVLQLQATSDGATSLQDVLPPPLYSMLAGIGPATDAGSRGPGIKLAPGWKPLRSGAIGGQPDDCNFEAGGDESGDDNGMSNDDMGEAINESGGFASRPVLRTPRHDSIIEGFGQFINEHVVLDSAFAEPDFKALSELDDSSPPGHDQFDDWADEQELNVEDSLQQVLPETVVVDSTPVALETSDVCAHGIDETDEAVGVDPLMATAEVGEEPETSMEDLAGDDLLRVVPPSEIDPDEIVLAAVVAPSLLEDGSSDLSELAIAGLSILRPAALGNEAGTSLLEDLGSEDPSMSSEKQCLSDSETALDESPATLEEAPVFPGATDDGFSSGNAALIRHSVSCPRCEQELRIQNRYVGIEGRCPACTVMIVAHRQPDGSVVANMAEFDSPKFRQQPEIEPQGEPGGMSLSYGNSALLKLPVSVQLEKSDGDTCKAAIMMRALVAPRSNPSLPSGDGHNAGDGIRGFRSGGKPS